MKQCTFQDDHFLYYVFNYIPGGSLHFHLVRGGGRGEQEEEGERRREDSGRGKGEGEGEGEEEERQRGVRGGCVGDCSVGSPEVHMCIHQLPGIDFVCHWLSG